MRRGRAIPAAACAFDAAGAGASARIEDPLDGSNNVARCVDPAGRARIRAECARALAELRRGGDVESLLALAPPPPPRPPAGAESPARGKRPRGELSAGAAAEAEGGGREAKRRPAGGEGWRCGVEGSAEAQAQAPAVAPAAGKVPLALPAETAETVPK